MTRLEHDMLGDREVPDTAYYGIHTLRAMENFAITDIPVSRHPALVSGLAAVKQAAAQANSELEILSARASSAIQAACSEIRSGYLHEQFVVDVLQGGAGTSTNMNANEVIANRALELLGHSRGSYEHLSPLDHVNLSQSTNDVYPTAVKLGLYAAIEALQTNVQRLADGFRAKSQAFHSVLKIGRTQLQDAVPMTIGQEFGAFATTVHADAKRLSKAKSLMTEINLGGTAIGTGLNTHPDYAARIRVNLSLITGVTLTTAPDLIAATQDVGAFVDLSAALRRTALNISKICNDLRLLSSGPQYGFGEIVLPAVQAGSSIMPGKINPVIPEVVNQVAFRVIGNDLSITLAAEGGQLQLNAFEPAIAHSLFESIEFLSRACTVLNTRCVEGIRVSASSAVLDTSVGIATALNRHIGYAAAAAIAADSRSTGRSISSLVLERGLLTEKEMDSIMQIDTLSARVPKR